MAQSDSPPDSTQDSTQNPPQQKTFRDRLDNLGKLLFGSADNRKPVVPQGDYRGDRQPPIVDSGSENQLLGSGREHSGLRGLMARHQSMAIRLAIRHKRGSWRTGRRTCLAANRALVRQCQPKRRQPGAATAVPAAGEFRQSPFGPDAQNAQSVDVGVKPLPTGRTAAADGAFHAPYNLSDDGALRNGLAGGDGGTITTQVPPPIPSPPPNTPVSPTPVRRPAIGPGADTPPAGLGPQGPAPAVDRRERQSIARTCPNRPYAPTPALRSWSRPIFPGRRRRAG